MSYQAKACPKCGSSRLSDVKNNKYIIYCETCKKFSRRQDVKVQVYTVVPYSERMRMIEEKYGDKENI